VTLWTLDFVEYILVGILEKSIRVGFFAFPMVAKDIYCLADSKKRRLNILAAHRYFKICKCIKNM
jgi:hypothetical protein